MKKKSPAKKGFAPFKENSSRTSAHRASGEESTPRVRKRKPMGNNAGDASEEGGKPEGPRTASGRTPFRPNAIAKAASQRGEGNTGFRKGDSDRPFRRSEGDKPAFRRNDKDNSGFRKQDGDKPFRKSSDRKSDSSSFRKQDGERPFRKSSDRSSDSSGFRKQDGERPFRKSSDRSSDSGGFRKQEGDRPFRKSSDRSSGSTGFRKQDGDKPFRKSSDRSSDSSSFRKQDGDRPFRKSSDRSSDSAGFRKQDGDKPFRKSSDRSSGSTGFRKQEGDRPFRKSSDRSSDKRDNYTTRPDSSFHGNTDNTPGKETPSGFNRKKYFDRANDRFADKQARKPTSIKPVDDDIDDFDEEDEEEMMTPPARPVSTNGEMPLNKFIAHCGLCSRRKAVDYIKDGKVTVNGVVVTEPATKVTAKDNVKLNEKKMVLKKNLVYVLLNKPKGYITTTDDPEGRQTVMDLITDATDDRIYPVGRLDRNTSGLLLLTNDGELAQKLAHPKHNIKKIYQVELDKPLLKADFEQILSGLELEDGLASVDALGYLDTKDKKQLGIEIHSGKNRIVRRIFEHLGYSVEKLDRVMYAGLTKKNVNRGKWRFLSEKEVILLKHFK